MEELDQTIFFERLNRVFTNQDMQEWFSDREVEHLARTGSNHTPLLIILNQRNWDHKKPFKFLQFQTKREALLDIMRINWHTDVELNYFYKLKHKLKHTKKVLSKWSKRTLMTSLNNSSSRRKLWSWKSNCLKKIHLLKIDSIVQKAQAKHKQYLHYEEKFWRQKVGLAWFWDGNRNTKFNHFIT